MMKNLKWLVFLPIILLVLIVINFIFVRNPAVSNKQKIAVTIFPLYDITKNIAGEELQVVLILPPGASPHTFDLTPKEARKLSGSQAVFSIGYGLDDWVGGIAQSTEIGNIITLDKNIKLTQDKNPHYWLSVSNTIAISQQIKDELSLIFPDKSDDFKRNFENYKIRLEALEREVKTKLGQLQDTKIATFHNAWEYFAQDYSITISAVFEEFPGKEPTAQYLEEFQQKIKASGIGVIFSEPQFSTKSLEPIARDLGVSFSNLDPLGGVSGRDSYESLIRYNVDRIVNTPQ